MSRTLAQALVLVNWKGIFYERYLIDQHVTALEGANGAGKTTVMIAAYVVLLPDMSRLRFTNLGETGATGGDKGIWGRLGEPGRPAYSAIDFAVRPEHRIVAGVHLERKGEPSVEPTPFIITGLTADVRLQDVLLLSQGDQELVPELSELQENAARAGGRMQVFNTANDYFRFLFEQGVMPLRLGTDEDRNKFNQMLRNSMTGGISRALTSELRHFLLREESGLANTLQRMRANLDACRRTRTEVQESRRDEQEIGGVFEAGQSMFEAAFFATRERAEEMRRRLTEAEEAKRRAHHQLAEAESQLARVCGALNAKQAHQASLSGEIDAANERFRRLQQALAAVRKVESHRAELASAEEVERALAEKRGTREKIRTQSEETHRRRQEDYNRTAEGLADLQSGLEEAHRRAGAYRQAVRQKTKAERLLKGPEITIGSIAERIADTKTRLARVDRSRREAKQRLDDVDAHRQEHAAALESLELMANSEVKPDMAHSAALQQLRRLRDYQALAGRATAIAVNLREARKLAGDQAEARQRLKEMGLSLAGQKPARTEIEEHLKQAEGQHGRVLEQEWDAREAIAQGQRTLGSLRKEQEDLIDREPVWRGLAARAKHIEGQLDIPVASASELQAAREVVKQRLAEIAKDESSLSEERERLRSEAQELLAVGGPFDRDLLRVKDGLGAEVLASAFEDLSVEDAAVTEAALGPLFHALIVDDPASAANQAHGRPASVPDLWLVNRDDDVAKIAMNTAHKNPETKDVVVSDGRATRVTRIPALPRLGRKAREKRAADFHSQADGLDTQIETLGADRRVFERLAEDGEALLAGQTVWPDGDPAPALEEINRKVLAAEAQQETYRTEAERHRQAAESLAPRVDGLKKLLGRAAYLDPPDHALRQKKIEQEYDSALEADAEVSRCSEAASTLEENLDALRRPPLTDQDVEDIKSRLDQLTEDRHRLDAAIEAMKFVDDNAQALQWSDAPEMLEAQKPLVPELKAQRDQAEAALRAAEAEAQAAKDAHDSATTAWQKADGQRLAVAGQLQAAEQDFTEIGVPDPTEAAVETARNEKVKLEEEGREIDTILADLNTGKGRREKEKEQADANLDDAEQKVSTERSEAEPAIDRWERLQADVAEHNILAAGVSQNDSDIAGIRGHVNLVQEARSRRVMLLERLGAAHGAQYLLDEADKNPADAAGLLFADAYLEFWLAVRDWLRRRLPAQVADVDDPRDALLRLRDQLMGLEERLARQEDDLRGSSENIARGIDVQKRKARGKIDRLNKNLRGVNFGSIEGIKVKTLPVDRMEQVLRALREGAVQGLLFQEDLPIEEAFDEIFQKYGGGRGGGQRLLDYREYLHLQVEVRRSSGAGWEAANPTRLSTGEAIGVGAALMMVVLTEWERDATLLRGKRGQGSLRLLFLDEANRLSHDNLRVLFDLCQTLELQLLIAAPEVAKADGNTTYRLVRGVDADGREEVLVSGRRARA